MDSSVIIRLAKENRTWKILDIVRNCKYLKEAEEKIKALLRSDK